MAAPKKASSTKTTKKATTAPKTTKAKKAPVVKKAVAAPAKRSTTKTTRKKEPKMESFQVYNNDRPFLTTKLTIQTVYWTVLSVVVLLLGLWVIDINDQISQIQDQIDMSIIEQSELDAREIELLRKQKADES